MVQLVKSTKDFEIFGAQPWPGTVRVSTENSKALGDFSQMRHFGTRNCRF
jgi:hypothetical protein